MHKILLKIAQVGICTERPRAPDEALSDRAERRRRRLAQQA